MTSEEMAQLPPAVPFRKAAAILGLHPETFRRHRALGYYRDLEFVKPGPRARCRIVTDSVLRCLDRMTTTDPE